MKKYTKDYIKILNEGHQIKRAIEEKYKTLKDFCDIEKPELAQKSIYNYCGINKVRSTKFKLYITKILDLGYNELVLTPVNQVKRYVNNMFYSIHLYNSEDDVEIFDTLFALCKQYNLQTEIAVMMRNYAKNLYYRNQLTEAINMYNQAVEYVLSNKLDTSELVLFYSELADIYFKEKDLFRSNENFELAKQYLDNETTNDRAKYYYYYYRGIATNKSGRYEDARNYFNEALKHAVVNSELVSQKGAALLNIGNAYKFESNYKESSRYYFAAVLYFHDSDIHGKSAILNNIADNCYKQEKYDEAAKYIEQALLIATQNGLSSASLILAQTSAELIMLNNKEKSPFKHYFNALRNSVNCPVDKYIIIENIITIINIIQTEGDLIELKEILSYLKSITENDEYMHDLYSCIGRINEKLEAMKGMS